jgi:hypothetical protein
LLLATVFKNNAELALNLIMRATRKADTSRVGDPFQSRCDVDARENVVALMIMSQH